MEGFLTKMGYTALGGVIAMAVVLCTIEYRRAEAEMKKLDSAKLLEDEEIEVIDLSNAPPPPPPPPPPP
ncbi:MAG: hypothetical protein N4A35_10090, partial [Flavobacteriales bacterium]|nr:hypothetical protein [Flavobacteriales bacterium]